MAQAAGGTSRATLRQALPWAGIVLGLWALVPPYAGPELANLESRVEVADHVVPGIVMLAVSVAVLARSRRAEDRSAFPLVAGMVVLLAGLWMTATHVPLVNQARRGEAGVTYGAAVWHTAPGVVVMILGLVWAATYWSAAADDTADDTAGRRPATKGAARR